MDDAKKQLADKLKSANNILVTVSRDPSVDQLASLLGLTLILNKQGKHAAAVFSGQIPSTIEFLEPEDTFEKNTDSLRDFIIALDKNKADKLRYKVEDDVVRIFITPYKTSISQEDFEFSQGDFNVDVVVALGVQQQDDLDDAITQHGRILHDATVTSISTSAEPGLGSINWHKPDASSLSELVTELSKMIDGAIDEQIATALLTGIVAETDRFSNDKTTSDTMSLSAVLMSAGANQQLVATKLAEPVEPPAEEQPEEPEKPEETEVAALPEVELPQLDGPAKPEPAETENTDVDGSIQIDHSKPADDLPETHALATGAEFSDVHPDGTIKDTPFELPTPQVPSDAEDGLEGNLSSGSKLVTEPPTLGGTLTANSSQPGLDPVTDPLSMPASDAAPILDRQDELPKAPDLAPFTPPEPPAVPPTDMFPTPLTPAPADTPLPDQSQDNDNSTLAELEQSVDSLHLDAGGLDTARDEVNRALNDPASTPLSPQPLQSLSAQPLGDDLRPTDQPAPDFNLTPPTPQEPPANEPKVIDPNAPPPVPPPIPFQFGDQGDQSQQK